MKFYNSLPAAAVVTAIMAVSMAGVAWHHRKWTAHILTKDPLATVHGYGGRAGPGPGSNLAWGGRPAAARAWAAAGMGCPPWAAPAAGALRCRAAGTTLPLSPQSAERMPLVSQGLPFDW
jgi:hypothetical protein